MVRSHVLPYAAPGMFTGAILALARAIGETAPLLLVGATTGYFSSPGGRGAAGDPAGLLHRPADPDLLLVARQPSATWGANTSAAIVVLLVAILAVNAIAIVLRNRYERKW